MLVLLSFALVLAATVLLVLGLLNDDGLTLIWISIASSVAAAIVLLVGLRLNKPRGAAAERPTGPSPLPAPEPEPAPATASAPAAGAATAAASTAERSSTSADDEWLASDLDSWEETAEPEDGEEVEFPIADYDSLTVGQILPLLPQLYADEIDVVDERERLTKARPQVLAKLAELRDSFAASGDVDALASYTEVPSPGWDDEDDWFPIEDYESLSAAQIRPLLPELDAEELSLVRTRELSLGRRRSLLDEIDRLLGASTAPAASAPAKKAPAKRTTSASAASKKAAPAKRGAASKKAAPARKATANKAAASSKKATPAKKATSAKKAPAKQAAPAAKKAAPAKKAAAPAKKPPASAKKGAAAKKAAAPAKKATPAKKGAAAKKATPAKRTNKR